MNRSSDFTPARIIDGLVQAADQPQVEGPKAEGRDPRLLTESPYLRCVTKAIKYLSLYTTGALDLGPMSPEERQRYVLGYGLPFAQAEVPQDLIWRLGEDGKGGVPGEATLRWMQKEGERFFPRNPNALVEVCKVIMKERAPGWTAPPTLPTPPPSREERNRQRVRLGLDPLPEFAQEAD